MTTTNNNEALTKMVEIDHKNLVSMSNQAIENRILENYGAYGMKIVMIGVVGAYAIGKKNYDHRFFIQFSVDNFAKLIGREEKYAISIFKKTCSLLRSKEVVLQGYLDGEETEFVTGILDTYAYSKNEKSLAVKFNSEFVPYFMEMSGNFTQYELSYALGLDKIESISFYCFIKMKIGKEFKNIIENKEYYFDIEEKILRQFFNVENSYTQQRDLKNKVLAKVAKEINENTDLTINFEVSQQSSFFTMTFKYKSDADKPSKISLEDFKLTKAKKTKPARKVGEKKNEEQKPAGKETPPPTEKPKNKVRTEDAAKETGKPKSLAQILKETSGFEPKKLSNDEIKNISDVFIKDHPHEYDLVSWMVDKKIITFKKHPADFIFYVLNTYHSRYGGHSLEEYVNEEFSKKLQAYYNEYKNSEVAPLSTLNMFYV
ncbi:RepB family plasmid replication initiator protein [Acinetobacter baumannii]|uniref:RepB family plasmid replication initiator protein n=1 Tax=Acinetobacter baumannii TaxID=470 RepID=UPI00387DCF46